MLCNVAQLQKLQKLVLLTSMLILEKLDHMKLQKPRETPKTFETQRKSRNYVDDIYYITLCYITLHYITLHYVRELGARQWALLIYQAYLALFGSLLIVWLCRFIHQSCDLHYIYQGSHLRSSPQNCRDIVRLD